MRISHKISLTTLLILLILLINGVAYSSWRDEVQIIGKAKIGKNHSKIIHYRLIHCHHHNFSCIINQINDLSLQIKCNNISNNNHFLIYVIIKNVGSIPVKINDLILRLIEGGDEGKLKICMAYLNSCNSITINDLHNNLDCHCYNWFLNESLYRIQLSRILDPKCKLYVLIRFKLKLNCHDTIEELKFTMNFKASRWNEEG